MSHQEAYIITANDLLLGDVIYLDKSKHWTRELTSSKLFQDKESADTQLAEVSKDKSVIGAYVVKFDLTNNQPTPAHFREEFRAKGPSNYFHGKQELLNV